MKRSGARTVLFLGTGDDARSRSAASLFNAVAARMNLGWQGSSRGLPSAPGQEVEAAITEAIEQAHWIVAVNEAEHLPLLRERFPGLLDRIEFWRIEPTQEGLATIEREVMDLAARLIGGGRKRVEPPPTLRGEETAEKPKVREKKAPMLRVGRETKGRRGKGVTTVADIPLDAAGIAKLAATLKQRCGTGGTVKDGVIEIQGDMRDRLTVVLEGLGYRVKRVGG